MGKRQRGGASPAHVSPTSYAFLERGTRQETGDVKISGI
jgi:hypothetical protein